MRGSNQKAITPPKSPLLANIKLPLYWKISTNEIYSSKHWSKRKQNKDNFRQAYINDLKKLGCFDEKIDIFINFRFNKKPLDSSNCSYLGKLIEDCLVKADVIKNDSIKHVGWFCLKSEKCIGEDSFEVNIYQSLIA